MSPEGPRSSPTSSPHPTPSDPPELQPERLPNVLKATVLKDGAAWIILTVCLAATGGAWQLALWDELHRPGLPETVLLVGVGFSLLLAATAHLLVTSRVRALELAESMTQALRQSEKRHRRIIDTTAEGFAEVDGDGRLVAVNDALCRTLGYQREEVIGRCILDFAEGQGRRVLAQQLALRADVEQRRYEVPLATKGGGFVLMRINSTSWFDHDDGRVRSFGLMTDITAEKQMEENQRLAAAILNAVRDGIMVTDLERRILQVNPAFTLITGYTVDEVVGQSPSLLASGRHGLDFYDNVWRTIGEMGYWQGDLWNRRKDGALFVSATTIVPIRDDSGRITHFVDVLHDITNRKEDEERAWHLANYDALTGLPNRLLLHDRLSQAVGRAQRSGGRFAMLYVDLDGFKPVNDRFGHAAGDELLQAAARRLQGCVRGSDTVARLGGDEFVVVLPDTAERTVADTVARKILGELNAPYRLAVGEATITASIGVALFPLDGHNGDKLLAAADSAMYRAKSAGKNRIAFAGDLTAGGGPARADAVEAPAA